MQVKTSVFILSQWIALVLLHICIYIYIHHPDVLRSQKKIGAFYQSGK